MNGISLKWQALLEKFWADAERLAQCTESLPPEQLEADFADPKYGTAYSFSASARNRL